jgi:hypothetical protein
MVFNKKDLEKGLQNAIELNEFEFGHDVTSFYWQQNKNGVINRIEIGYRKYPGSFYLRFPLAFIKFNEIENILEEFIKKHKIETFYGKILFIRVLEIYQK